MNKPAIHCASASWWTALLVVVAIGLSASAEARHHRSKKSKDEAETKSEDAGKPAASGGDAAAGNKDGAAGSAPAAGAPALPAQTSDYPAAIKKAEDAYRQQPGPEILLQLGLLADGQGRVLEAQDYMRRYMADPLVDANALGRVDAERVLAKPRPASSELQIIADQNGMVTLDGRLVGSLPLSAPLLVSPGKHNVTLELRDRTMKGQLKAVEGRGMEMNFSRANGAVVVTLPTAVIVVPRFSGAVPSQEAQRKFQQAAELGVTQGRLAVFSKDVALKKAEKAAECLDTVDCQAQLAAENDVDYVLVVQVERKVSAPAAPPAAPARPGVPPPPPPPGKETWSMRLSLVDAESVDVAAAAEPSCPGCGGDQLVAVVSEQVRGMIKEAQAKGRGSWAITSEPPGATIRVGNRVIGKTPLNRAALAGSFELIFEKPQFKTEKKQVEVQAGQKAQVAVTLAAEEVKPVQAPVVIEKPVAPPAKRPLWRIITGSVLAAAGVGLLGFGISALSVNGSCVAEPIAPATRCLDRFSTGTVGGALTGVGAAALVGGVLLIAIPNSGKSAESTGKAKQARLGGSTILGPGSLGWGLSASESLRSP
jgi:hypothetical protein